MYAHPQWPQETGFRRVQENIRRIQRAFFNHLQIDKKCTNLPNSKMFKELSHIVDICLKKAEDRVLK